MNEKADWLVIASWNVCNPQLTPTHLGGEAKIDERQKEEEGEGKGGEGRRRRKKKERKEAEQREEKGVEKERGEG